MKRKLSNEGSDAEAKRSRSSLAFFGTGLQQCKAWSHSDAWHAAKQLVADQLVSSISVVQDTEHSAAVHVRGSISAFNPNTASFPHLLEPYSTISDSPSSTVQLPVDVQTSLHVSTGEVIDASSSCCPGGFQPVLGSFCPCVTAVLLAAAKQAAVPAHQQTPQQQANLPAWTGSSAHDVLTAQQQLPTGQQHANIHSALCLVTQPSSCTTGLGLGAWEHEQAVCSTARVHVASQRAETSLYGGPRMESDPDTLASVEDADADLSTSPWYDNTSNPSSTASQNTETNAAPASTTEGKDPAAAAAGESPLSAAKRQQVLLCTVAGDWLTLYNGQIWVGWCKRPKVVNEALELLTGGTSTAAAGRPLSSLVLLLRALWLYLHHHGLGRLLAKPFKLLMAVRNVLLVSSIPLWLRKSVHCQMDIWERGLLLQHAAKPLQLNGNVAIVHLLRVMQEVRQLCLHHWDSPQLAKLLRTAIAEDGQQQHKAGSSEVVQWHQELPSLLQLRLKMLDVIGLQNAYLELAMAGGAWTEAINRMLKSKERSQLLKAVSLLPRHITSLSERMSYMCQLLELKSLGPAELLEVTARLMLGIRDELLPEQHNRYIPGHTYPASSSRPYSGYIWKSTLYAMSAAAALGRRNHSAEQRLYLSDSLHTHWGRFLKAFVKIAAQALFDAGKESKAAYDEHMKTVQGRDEEEAAGHQQHNDEQQRQQRQTATEAEGTTAAAKVAAFVRDAVRAAIFAGATGTPYQAAAGLQPASSMPLAVMFLGTLMPLPVVLNGLNHDEVNEVVQTAIDHALEVANELVPTSPAPAIYRYCDGCNEHHKVDVLSTRVQVAAARRRDTRVNQGASAGTSTPCDLLAIDWSLFGAYESSSGAHSRQASAAALQARSKTGYILDRSVLKAYRKVIPAQYPELLPLCSLDAACLSTLSSVVMSHFDSGGSLDTSLPLDPLKEMMSHQFVEMGPGPVRIQAALEVVVYATAMTPLKYPAASDLDLHYKSLMFMLLGAGQRRLALLVARARFKLVPGPCAAAQLMEVAIASGSTEEAAAVDLILGKGLVRDPDGDDERLLCQEHHTPASNPHDERVHRLQRADGLMEAGYDGADDSEDGYGASDDYADSVPDYANYSELEYMEDYQLVALARQYEALVARSEPLDHGRHVVRRRRRPRTPEFPGSSPGSYSGGKSRSTEIASSREAKAGDAAEGQAPSKQQQEVQRRAAEAAAAATAAGKNPAVAALAAARAAEAEQSEVTGKETAAEDGNEGSSLDTRRLLGAAADQIQLNDTADSSAAAPGSSSTPITAAPALAAPAAAQDAEERPMRGQQGFDYDMDFDEDDLDPDYEYYRARATIRDLPPANLPARPGRFAGASSSKRSKYTASSSQTAAAKAAAAAAAGGGGGGGGGSPGDGDDPHAADGGAGPGGMKGGGSAEKKRRRSPRSSTNQFADAQQAALASELFGISETSHTCPGKVLRVHIRRLSGLQLWTVAKYAAGRGAAADSSRRLGLAAWLSYNSDGTTAGNSQGVRAGDRLSWEPVCTSQDSYLSFVRACNDAGTTQLIHHASTEPHEGASNEGRYWHGTPAASWNAFVAQQRQYTYVASPSGYSNPQQAHNSPDANLAWLIARLTPPTAAAAAAQATISTAQPANEGAACCSSGCKQGREPAATAADTSSSSVGFACAAAFIPCIDPAVALPDANSALRQWYTFSETGPHGAGLYKKASLTSDPMLSSTTTAAAAAAAAGTSTAANGVEQVPDLSAAVDVLHQLASLSKGLRFGFPILQLCHALLNIGSRSACLSLLPQGLLPAAAKLSDMLPNTCLVSALHGLLPSIMKHGDVCLRVSAVVTDLLLTRRPVPAEYISEQEVLSGVMSWWLGLVAAVDQKPDDWQFRDKASAINADRSQYAASTLALYRDDPWRQLERMLVKCILPGLAVKHASNPAAAATAADGGATSEGGGHAAAAGAAAGGAAAAAPSTSGVVPGGGCKTLEAAAAAASGAVASCAAASGGLAAATEGGISSGLQMFIACRAVDHSPWQFKLYLVRVLHELNFCSDLVALSHLLLPALAAAVQQHLETVTERGPITDMQTWKLKRHVTHLNDHQSMRAEEWVQQMLLWITGDLKKAAENAVVVSTTPCQAAAATGGGGGGAAGSSSSSGGMVHSLTWSGAEELNEFVNALHAAVLGSGWYGPELLLLAAAVRKLQQQQQQDPCTALLQFIAAGLLPAAGRATELARNPCVTDGRYKEVLRQLMKDEALLPLMPQEVVRNLALTYWYQEATPAALLTASDLLIKLEGSSGSQQLTVPAAPAPTANGSSSSSNNNNPSAVAAQAAGSSAVPTCIAAAAIPASSAAPASAAAAGGSCGVPGLPPVHPVLLQHLDLVPSRGGIEAAGLRFMQLQVHAAAGNFEAALESAFSSASDTSSTPGNTAAASSSSSMRLEDAMEVADAVLRLAEESSHVACIRDLLASEPCTALKTLSAPSACCAAVGDPILASLSTNMKKHIIRLLIWRISRTILQKGPGIAQRMISGPHFPSSRSLGSATTRPQAPSYTAPQVQARWLQLPANLLVGWCAEHTAAVPCPPGSHPQAALVSTLCTVLQSQEEALLWCVLRYATWVTGAHLERDLESLIGLENRARLGQLPVFIMGLGERVKYDRGMMWAYCAFKTIGVISRVAKYIHRYAHDTASLTRYLVKSTLSEIQSMKAISLPWYNWDMGPKAIQAAELSEWLWWYMISWSRVKLANGGVGLLPMTPYAEMLVQVPPAVMEAGVPWPSRPV